MGLKGSSREKVKIIVCDAGPVIHLHEAGILPLLRKIGDGQLKRGAKTKTVMGNDSFDL